MLRLSKINSNRYDFAKHISGFWINSIIDNVSELMDYRESKMVLVYEEWPELLKIMKRNMQKSDKIYTILLILFSLQP